jgi:hypothetical protein
LRAIFKVDDDEIELMQAAVTALLYLVPGLADSIERDIPSGSTDAERRLHLLQKGWAELCQSAAQADLDPFVYAKHLVMLYQEERLQNPPH